MRSSHAKLSRSKILPIVGLALLLHAYIRTNLFASENNELSIGIVAMTNKDGADCLPFGAPFDVILANHSDHLLKIWDQSCKPGYQALSFRTKTANGEKQNIQRS